MKGRAFIPNPTIFSRNSPLSEDRGTAEEAGLAGQKSRELRIRAP
jgi:hypothetical protein